MAHAGDPARGARLDAVRGGDGRAHHGDRDGDARGAVREGRAVFFDSPEYFAIVLFGFTSVVTLGGGSLANALISLFVGMLISTVGVDEIYGVDRFTFGVGMLRDGIGYLPVMVGAYGLGEVLVRLEQGFASAPLSGEAKVKTRIPTFARGLEDPDDVLAASVVGVICGIVPGAGATIASFVAYGVEGQYGERRAELGTGIRGRHRRAAGGVDGVRRRGTWSRC